jgi:hypothetical protein
MLATELGYTFRDIDEMVFEDLDDLFEYWKGNSPPLTMMVAAYLGVKKETKRVRSKDDLRKLAAEFGGK